MYRNIVAQIINGNIKTSMYFKVGIKQGNIMAPVLFLLLTMTFYKTLEDKWTDLGLSKA